MIKNKWNSMSLKWKIFSIFVMFSLTLLLVLWLFQVIFLDSFYKGIKINETKSTANTIESNINSSTLKSIVDKLSENRDINIMLMSSSENELYTSTYSQNGTFDKFTSNMIQDLISKASKNNGQYLEYYDPNDFKITNQDIGNNFEARTGKNMNSLETIVYVKIVDSKIIVITCRISPVDATVNTLRTQLYYITIFMIIFSLIVALILTKVVSKPIEKITNSAKILATGKFDVVFSGTGYKEINELTNTLNYAANELGKTDNLRKELIANVSHDLRTPLTLINGYAEVLRDFPDEENKENIEIIIEETNRLTTLVNDILDISHLENSKNILNKTKYNLTESINKVILRMSEFTKRNEYVIEFEHDKEIYVNADKTKIEQAFYNLLINALNYTGEDKKVVVKQIINNDIVTIQVIDTGIGIDEKYIQHIWERYYKVDKEHIRPVTGSGLGLSIVKNVISLNDGEYGVESKLNSGSKFWFSLPIDK